MTVTPVGALVALLLGLTGVAAALPAAAVAPSAPTQVAASAHLPSAVDDATGSVVMTVSPDELVMPAAGQDLHITVTIANHTARDIGAGVVVANVDRDRLTTPGMLERWLGGADDGATSDEDRATADTEVARIDTPPITAGETRIVPLTANTGALGFPGEGVYALGAAFTVDGLDVATGRSAVTWKTAAVNPLRIATVAPLVVPAATSGLITAADLEKFTAQGGLLSEQLEAMTRTTVTIGIDPRILASIRILGTGAPQVALDWLARLDAAQNATLPLAYADSDLTIALQAGAPGPLAPSSFDFAIDRAQFATPDPATADPRDPSAKPLPSPTDAAIKPTLPTLADLTAWDYTFPALGWPSAGSMTNDSLAALAAAGYSQTILSSENVTRAGPPGAQGVSTTVGTNTVARSDATLSRLLEKASAASTPATLNVAMAEVSSTAALMSELSPAADPTVLATLGRSWPATGYRLEDAMSAMFALPWAMPASLSGALEAPASAGELIEAPVNQGRVDAVAALLAAEAADTQFAVVVADPLALTAARRVGLLAILSNAWRQNPADWQAATLEYLDRSTAIRESVQIASSSTIQLLADRGSLPVTVSNELNQAVTVFITVQPRTAVLRVENTRVELVVEPQSSRKAQIPVQSLSNGEVQLNVSLTDAAGAQVGRTAPVELNVHAGWETAGTIAVGIAVVLIFGIGIFRTIRKRRIAARDDMAEDGAQRLDNPAGVRE